MNELVITTTTTGNKFIREKILAHCYIRYLLAHKAFSQVRLSDCN